MEGYEHEFSLWVNEKDKNESYVIQNCFTEKNYKKGDTIVFLSFSKKVMRKVYLHEDMKLMVEFDEDDIVWSEKLDYFHDEIVSHKTFYFNRPGHHATAVLLKNGTYILIRQIDGDSIHKGQVYADKESFKSAIEELHRS